MIMSRKMNNMDAYFSSAKDEKVRSSSFSSTLLEAVYRSIDKEGQQPDEMSMFGAERNAKKKQTSGRDYSCSKREEIEKWMEKKNVSSGFHDDGNPRRKVLSKNNNVLLSSEMARNHGLMSSSHCSHYSSSTVERDCLMTTTISKIPKSKSTNSGYQLSNPTREATSSNSNKVLRQSGGASASTSSSRQFHKTKSHALKFYKELKKMKQPISPGGRLATLINSLFLTGHSKKAKFANDNDNHEGGGADHQQPNNENTCSSGSSFAGSCLSHKTSSSSASSTNKAIRSVRFSSTIFNEQKPVKMDDGDHCSDYAQTGGDDIQALLRKYHNADLFAIYSEFEEAAEEDDDEAGVSSCGSSDLFELDHLMGPIGMEELPVYETTLLSANRPIANSLLA